MQNRFQHRGVAPSAATANAVRDLITEVGDWQTARFCGHTRLTVARVAARLPVNPTTIADIESRLAARREADRQHVG